MIYPKHHKLYRSFFSWYARHIIASDFSSFKVESGSLQLGQSSLLVVANHFSWWDGFFHYYLNEKVFRKRYHVMMLEEELRKRMFLTRLGAFGVKKGSKEVLESLSYAHRLLENDQNMVLIFPQGKIESQHQHHFEFEKGIERIVRSAPKAQLVFVVSLIDYFSQRKPQVVHYIEVVSHKNSTHLQMAYNAFFQQCLQKQKETYQGR